MEGGASSGEEIFSSEEKGSARCDLAVTGFFEDAPP
jgi:hypothetical protein